MYKQTMKLTSGSSSSILLVCDTLADPLNPMTKKYKKLTSIMGKAKTDEVILAIAEQQYKCGIYWDEEVGVYVPAVNIRKCLEEGAKASRDGPKVRRGVFIKDPKIALEYTCDSVAFGGTNKRRMTPDQLWKDGRFLDKRAVVVNKSRIMCYRPKFTDWSLTVDVFYDPDVAEAEGLLSYFTVAGKYIGLGGYRPDKGGMFGRFNAALVGDAVQVGE